MKTCPACGALNPDNALFCSACGTRLGTAPGQAPRSGPAYQNPDPPYAQGPAWTPAYTGGVIPRSIVLAIILSLITCGLYSLYWMYKVNDELNLIAGNPQGTSGGMVVLFDIITCGIYGIYWAYKMGQNCGYLNGDFSSGILYVLLALFGFQIINLALFQDTINRWA